MIIVYCSICDKGIVITSLLLIPGFVSPQIIYKEFLYSRSIPPAFAIPFTSFTIFQVLFLRLKGRRGEAKIKRCPVEERKQGCLVQESLPEITEDRVVVSSMGKNEQAKLFLNSEICLRFRDKNPWRPAANDWAELYRNLDLAYDNFTVRLRNLIPITDKELQTACLIKAGVMPGVIGQLLCCSPASVSMTRKRLYEKIYQKPGSAELFDQFISQF